MRSSGLSETTQSAHAASRYPKNSSGPCRLSARNEEVHATHAAVPSTHLRQCVNSRPLAKGQVFGTAALRVVKNSDSRFILNVRVRRIQLRVFLQLWINPGFA